MSARSCWAASLGGCDDKITGEHIVSQCLFPGKGLMVQGLSWCKDAPKPIGKASLVRNILCRTHNSALSEVDDAALAAFNAFRESARLSEARKGINAKWLTVRRFTINGPTMERWFLKTLIDVAYTGDLVIGLGDGEPGIPQQELVRIAFGQATFLPYAGLYLTAHTGENVLSEDRVRIVTKSDGRNLVAAAFAFRGYRFFLNLRPQRLTMDGVSQLMYRDTKLNFLVHNKMGRSLFSHQISVKW